jgi:nucleoside-diphosphate-sugar epimerase
VPTSVVRILAALMETFSPKGKSPLLYKERVGELIAPNWNCSIEQAKKYLHYQPQYDLKKGGAETLKWYKENGWIK